jgi:hypothetical protein
VSELVYVCGLTLLVTTRFGTFMCCRTLAYTHALAN